MGILPTIGVVVVSVSFLTIGSEVLDGRVLNTNAQYLAEFFVARGYALRTTLVCDDTEEDIISALSFLSTHARIVIVSGGLGPTTDDLTRESIAAYIGQPLEENELAASTLMAWYERRGRALDDSNRKQILIPRGGEVVENVNGSAPGFSVSHDNTLIFALPGVPSELKPMVEAQVVPRLSQLFPDRQKEQVAFFRLFGLPEAQVNSRMRQVSLPATIAVSYRARFPEIHLLLKGAEPIQEHVCQSVREAVGEEKVVNEVPSKEFAATVLELLRANNCVVSTAESCTGGLVGELLTAIPGSSESYAGGVVSYSNKLKSELLGVSEITLREHGAVSAEVAVEMAEGARRLAECYSVSQSRSSSSYGVSITGVAGPDGGTPGKPVGTFFVAISTPSGNESRKLFFPSSRDKIRRFAAYSALDWLRRQLLS